MDYSSPIIYFILMNNFVFFTHFYHNFLIVKKSLPLLLPIFNRPNNLYFYTDQLISCNAYISTYKKIPGLTLFTIFFIFPFFFFSCHKKSSSPVIARVGKAILTVDDLNHNIPQEYSSQITVEQNINYVKQWIDIELLYQNALRNKIDKEIDIKKRFNKMKKDLLVAEVIHRSSIQAKSAVINDSTIHAYYEQNKQNFRREKDIVKYLEIVVVDSRIAWYLSKNGTPNNFIPFSAEYSQQPIPENYNAPFTMLDELPPEIKQTLLSTSVGSISNPVKTEDGYHVLYVIDKLYRGEICKELEIREEIVNQLSSKFQKDNLNQLLADLRLKTSITFNADLIKNINKNLHLP